MSILRTRLFKPPLEPRLLRRHRQIERLKESASVPFVLVCAPAGYGKSVLVSQWLDEEERTHVWLSLDSELDALSTIVEYLVEAIEHAISHNMLRIRNLIKTSELLDYQILVDELINELAEIQEDIILVLDDYHCITEQAVHYFIDTLLLYPIPGLQLVLITRTDPPISLVQLRARGKMLEFRMENLSFDAEDCTALTQMLNRGVSDQVNIETLLKRTEGWIMGIRMILASGNWYDLPPGETSSISRNVNIDHFLSHLRLQIGHDEAVGLYLASLCTRFNADLLGFVLKTDHSVSLSGTQLIAFLLDNNLFVIAQDQDNYWYRFHHLFRDLIRREFFVAQESKVEAYYMSMSEWFEEHGYIEEAIQYAVLSGHENLPGVIIGRHRFDVLDKDQWWVVQNWLSLVPMASRRKSVELLLAQLWVMEDTFQVGNMTALLATISRRLQGEEALQEYEPELHFHQAWYALIMRSDADGALYHLDLCGSFSRDSKLFHARRQLYLAMARQMKSGLESALLPLRQFEAENDSQGLVALRLSLAKVWILLVSGNFNEARKAADIFLFNAEHSPYEATKAYSYYLSGNCYFQIHDFDLANKYLEKALTFKGVLNYRVYIDAFAGWAFLHSLRGEVQKVWNALDELESFISNLRDNRFTEFSRSTKARIAWQHRRADPYYSWASRDWRVPVPTEALFAVDIPELTKLRIYLSLCPSDKIQSGLQQLDKIQRQIQEAHNEYQEIDLLICRVIGLSRQNMVKEAGKLMDQVVTLSYQRNQIRPLIELSCALPQIFDDTDLSRLPRTVQRTLRERQTHEQASTGDDEVFFRDLSQREIEILRMMAKGYRNKDIADALYLSEGTIKGYIHTLYKKIGARNRAHAIALHQELDL